VRACVRACVIAGAELASGARRSCFGGSAAATRPRRATALLPGTHGIAGGEPLAEVPAGPRPGQRVVRAARTPVPERSRRSAHRTRSSRFFETSQRPQMFSVTTLRLFAIWAAAQKEAARWRDHGPAARGEMPSLRAAATAGGEGALGSSIPSDQICSLGHTGAFSLVVRRAACTRSTVQKHSGRRRSRPPYIGPEARLRATTTRQTATQLPHGHPTAAAPHARLGSASASNDGSRVFRQSVRRARAAGELGTLSQPVSQQGPTAGA
jgi:hypothetical protein